MLKGPLPVLQLPGTGREEFFSWELALRSFSPGTVQSSQTCFYEPNPADNSPVTGQRTGSRVQLQHRYCTLELPWCWRQP